MVVAGDPARLMEPARGSIQSTPSQRGDESQRAYSASRCAKAPTSSRCATRLVIRIEGSFSAGRRSRWPPTSPADSTHAEHGPANIVQAARPGRLTMAVAVTRRPTLALARWTQPRRVLPGAAAKRATPAVEASSDPHGAATCAPSAKDAPHPEGRGPVAQHGRTPSLRAPSPSGGVELGRPR